MEKKYVKPEMMTVVLNPMQMLAESLPIGEEQITYSNEILTKEDKSAGKNIWDEEW